jgi:hypothetical protein
MQDARDDKERALLHINGKSLRNARPKAWGKNHEPLNRSSPQRHRGPQPRGPQPQPPFFGNNNREPLDRNRFF